MKLEQTHVYLTQDHKHYLQRHPEFNLSGYIRNEIDKLIKLEKKNK